MSALLAHTTTITTMAITMTNYDYYMTTTTDRPAGLPAYLPTCLPTYLPTYG